MSQNFKLDNSNDSDTGLTLVLVVIAFGLSVVNVWITIPPFAFHPSPLVMFVVTRWAYKRHFKKRMASLSATEADAVP